MRILLTNHALNYPGGSETACYTLATELVRLGHEVDYYTHENGLVFNKLKELGCKPLNDGTYDLAICSHLQFNDSEWDGIEVRKLIRICHGTTPKLEQPKPGADHYVAISEEVQDHLKGLGYESTVIRNGIDCERFKPTRESNKELKRVLLISASEKAAKLMKEACNQVGASLTVTNKVQNPRWDMENLINEHDLVVSLGRGALEGMACGRPVIVWDWRNYQGNMGDGYAVNDSMAFSHARLNFSGRFHRAKFTADYMVQNFMGLKELEWNPRQWVLENANIRKTAQQYLEL